MRFPFQKHRQRLQQIEADETADFWRIAASSYMRTKQILCAAWIAILAAASAQAGDPVHLRANQIGYRPDEHKVAVAFSNDPVEGNFSLVDADGEAQLTAPVVPNQAGGWGCFEHYYRLDFTEFDQPGRYRIRVDATGELSRPFTIGPAAYGDSVEELLRFMRQQRCGFNPTLDCVCHQRDGRTAYGPRPEGTFIDASGGWHDAGDQLKYLITGSYATAHMLLAYELEPTKFDDRVDRLGHPRPNGVPDVLDEARWGLEWIFKLHPTPHELYHQVADDRDHNGWKMPDEDTSDYGWGPNSYRVVYAADGKPQGLREHKSTSTGLANLAGRSAAAMAAAHRIWSGELNDQPFADRCLAAAHSLYALGKANEGYQQGNSYGAPYRYNENTWADDMEWAAAELYRETGEDHYLQDALRYADLAADTSWMPLEEAPHYQYYPFVNVGHFALYPHVDEAVQQRLAGYYRTGLEATTARAKKSAFGVGVPFIWCSNNLAAALMTQALLYEHMTGDDAYREHLLAQRDWLFGCNPWGTTMFTGLPRGGETPVDVHTSTWKLTRRDVAGGLVDGPVYGKVYNGLIGLHLENPDEFAEFQTDHVVYHDDIGDYSTNEPTMDGTAGAILAMAHFGSDPKEWRRKAAESMPAIDSGYKTDEGAIRRGPTNKRRLALIFTADKYVEGAETIQQALAERDVVASFFVTGKTLAADGMRDWVRRAVEAGHYVGPHSHAHLLYAPWDDRQLMLVKKAAFQADLHRNLAELRDLGAAWSTPVYFVPPFEWHNRDHTAWAAELGCQMINFTLGTGSHRDFAPEGHAAFRPSAQLAREILDHESSQTNGLNGHILLLHLGSLRQDKMHPRVGPLMDELTQRGYEFVTVESLLDRPGPPGESHAVGGQAGPL